MVLDGSHRWSDDIPGKARADGDDQDLDAKQRALGAGRDSDALVRSDDGVPDYTDPRYCPVLFDSGAT